MSIRINVDYKDKDKAKNKGAFWDSELKTWFIPDNKKISDFEEWLPVDTSIIVKNPFFVVKNSRICWKCNNEIPLIALAAEKYILNEYDDDSENSTWKIVNSLTLFSDITYLPPVIVEKIQSKYPFFKLSYSKTIGGKYWANTCIHCKALQGDFFNHCEPDGAFFPTSVDEAKVIELLKLDMKHDFPLRGNYSFGDTIYLIDKYSKRNIFNLNNI